jgi:hypothetical protein
LHVCNLDVRPTVADNAGPLKRMADTRNRAASHSETGKCTLNIIGVTFNDVRAQHAQHGAVQSPVVDHHGCGAAKLKSLIDINCNRAADLSVAVDVRSAVKITSRIFRRPLINRKVEEAWERDAGWRISSGQLPLGPYLHGH